MLTFGLYSYDNNYVKSKRFVIGKELLEKLYWNDRLSIKDISSRLDISHRTVHIRMLECGIKRRLPGIEGPNLSYLELRGLYMDKCLSSRKIAKIYNCAYSTIDRKIRSFGFPVKTLAGAHINFERSSFSGDLLEKAYLIGFRIGDLRVRKRYKNSESVTIDCGSTHRAQIDLIKSLFSRYGRVWISKPSLENKVQIQCGVDLSFDFLLPKFQEFPKWSINKTPTFLSILAGFTDAEGCFYLSKDWKRSNFSIGNYNLAILKQIGLKLGQMGYFTRLHLGRKKGSVGVDGYMTNENYWIITLDRKLELLSFTKTILPYLRHREKIRDANKVIKSILWRNKVYG